MQSQRKPLGLVSPARLNRINRSPSPIKAKLRPLPEQLKIREKHVKDAVKIEKLGTLSRKFGKWGQRATLSRALSKWRSATLSSALTQIARIEASFKEQKDIVTFASPPSARKRQRTWVPQEEDMANRFRLAQYPFQADYVKAAPSFRRKQLKKAFRALKLGLGIFDDACVAECDKILAKDVDHPAVTSFLQELRISAAADEVSLRDKKENGDVKSDEATPMKSGVIFELKKTCEKLDKRFTSTKAEREAHAERLALWKKRYASS